MLKAEDIVLQYGKHKVIHGADLRIAKGEIVTIIGANGSGKSTILRALSRNLTPAHGTVFLDGKEILSMNTKEVAKKLAVLPQIHSVPDDFSVRDLVSYGRFPHLSPTGRMHHKDFVAVDRAIEMTKMGHLQHRLVSTLSGGERQRAWIAMALAQEPEILLLDEPTTFLDISHQFELLEMIKRLNEDTGLTFVMILHDLNQASRYSKRLIVLKNGNVYRAGSPEEIITPELLGEVFNIQVRIHRDPEFCCPYFIPLQNRYA